VRSAKALATMMLTQRGTPFLYQGDELGMTNYPFECIEDYDDVEVKGLWRTLVDTGKVPAGELLSHLRQTSRDHARTPMQWSADAHGGFSSGRPWLAANPNFAEINAAAQHEDPDSVFHHHRQLIALRRAVPALVHGALHDLDPAHPQVFAYTRTLPDQACLVLVNLGGTAVDLGLPAGVVLGAVLLDNGAGGVAAPGAATVSLAPWQATVYRST
jgi:oligo-1,6-glucosidase